MSFVGWTWWLGKASLFTLSLSLSLSACVSACSFSPESCVPLMCVPARRALSKNTNAHSALRERRINCRETWAVAVHFFALFHGRTVTSSLSFLLQRNRASHRAHFIPARVAVIPACVVLSRYRPFPLVVSPVSFRRRPIYRRGEKSLWYAFVSVLVK